MKTVANLLLLLDKFYDTRRHFENLTQLWQNERWFDASRQLAAADFIGEQLRRTGCKKVSLMPYICDGKTFFQGWPTRLMWDCQTASLCFTDDGYVLADRNQSPMAVVQWCAPLGTADKPIVAQVVDLDSCKAVDHAALNDKFVFTSLPPLVARRKLQGCDPLAIINDHLGPGRGYNPATSKWWNAWTDLHNGWHTVATDRQITGFNLNQSNGAILRSRIASDPSLRLSAHCNARIFSGESYNVTAVLEGYMPTKEIWLYGHAYEPGAHDNCSGVTIMIEAIRLLQMLIDKGLLPRPRFSIRVIATEECLGMLAFGTNHPELLQKAIAGMNIDGAGDPGVSEDPFYLHFGPLSQPTFAWQMAAIIGAEIQKNAGDHWHLGNKLFVPTADDMIGDPHAGVGTIWLGKGKSSLGYHSDADTPAVCCPFSLRYNTLLATAWAYLLANLDESLVREILPFSTSWTETFLMKGAKNDAQTLRKWVAGKTIASLSRWGIKGKSIETMTSSYCHPDATPLPNPLKAGDRFDRTTWGTSTFATLPTEKRLGLSCWSSVLAAGYYWCNGKRHFSEIERLVQAEIPGADTEILRHGFMAATEAGNLKVKY